MHCETCGREIGEPAQAAVSLEEIARLPDLVDALADDYFATYGVPVTRATMRRAAEMAGGCVTLCDDCQVRLSVPGAEPGAALDASHPFDPPQADLSSGVASAPVGWCLTQLASPDPANRALATRSLIQAGREALPALLDWLRQPTVDRSAGVRVLGYLPTEDGAPVLADIIVWGDEAEREAAWMALRALGKKALPALEEALGPASPAPPEGKREILLALAHTGPAAVPVICSALADPEPFVRQAAFDALELTPSPAAIEALHEQFADPDRRLRKAAVTILGRMDDGRAVPPLVEALEDPSTEVRTSAGWALTRLGQPISWPEEEAAPDWKVDGWLYAGLLQLCGRSRDEIEVLLASKGVPIEPTAPVREPADVIAEAKELIAAGQLEAAEAALQEARTAMPFEVGLTALVAQCRAQAKRWDAAAEMLEEVVALDPFTARWHHNLGVAKWQLGAKGLALGQWEQTLLLDPTHTGASEAVSRAKSGEGSAVPTVCIAHVSLQAVARCSVCNVPLCRECAYPAVEQSFCERHVPSPPETTRAEAEKLARAARAAVRRLGERLCDTLKGSEGRLLLDVAIWSVLGPGAFNPPAAGAEASAPAVRALQEALILDPACEEAAVVLADLGELCDAAGYPRVAPADLRQWAWETCARSGPGALLARFVVHSGRDPRGALRGYFHRLVRSSSVRWDRDTARVITGALAAGLADDLAACLRAVLPRLRPHSPERRDCRWRLRALEAS
jgi:HEAT repeat protein